MDTLNKEFIDKVVNRFNEIHHINDEDKSISSLYAKISAEIFAISFNTLIRDGYLQKLQNDSSEE